MISCPDAPAPGLPPSESPLAPDRKFECQLDGIGELVPMGKVRGEEGSFLALRPAGRECRFHIVYQRAGGEKVTLTESPGGYLFLAGKRWAAGEMVVCASNLSHRGESPGSAQRIIERVTIDCFRQRDGRWGAGIPVVIPDGPWAAWLHADSFGRPPEGEREDEGALSLRYGRDFSFQFMNTIDAGRPREDGYYLLTLDLSSELLTPLNTPQRVANISEASELSGESGEPEPWDPSEEEIEAFEAEIEELLGAEEGEAP